MKKRELRLRIICCSFRDGSLHVAESGKNGQEVKIQHRPYLDFAIAFLTQLTFLVGPYSLQCTVKSCLYLESLVILSLYCCARAAQRSEMSFVTRRHLTKKLCTTRFIAIFGDHTGEILVKYLQFRRKPQCFSKRSHQER